MTPAEEPNWKQPRRRRLAQCKAALAGGEDPQPLETFATIKRIEAAEAREQELAILWAEAPR